MESSIAVFLMRRLACELLPTRMYNSALAPFANLCMVAVTSMLAPRPDRITARAGGGVWGTRPMANLIQRHMERQHDVRSSLKAHGEAA